MEAALRPGTETEKKNRRNEEEHAQAMIVVKHASWCWTITCGYVTFHALICASARAVILGAAAANQEEENRLFQREEMSSVRQEGNHANLSGKLINPRSWFCSKWKMNVDLVPICVLTSALSVTFKNLLHNQWTRLLTVLTLSVTITINWTHLDGLYKQSHLELSQLVFACH